MARLSTYTPLICIVSSDTNSDCEQWIQPPETSEYHTGYVDSGSDNWNKHLEKRTKTETLENGWNGQSKADTETKENVDEADGDISVNYLRGRRLLGETYDFKKSCGYEMLVMEEKDDGICGLSDDKIMELKGICEKVISYGHDEIPDKDSDTIERVKEWIDDYRSTASGNNNENLVASSQYIDSSIFQQFIWIVEKYGVASTLDRSDYRHRKRMGIKLPATPIDSTGDELNSYVTRLDSLDFKNNQELLPYLTDIYMTLTDSPLLSAHSFNLIISFFAKQYKTLECYQIRTKMEKLNRQANTETINILLDVTFRKHHQWSKKSNTLELLGLFGRPKSENSLEVLRPNGTTCHVMYRGLEDSDLKQKILETMIDSKVSLFRIAEYIAEEKLKVGRSPEDVCKLLTDHKVKWSYPPIASKFVDWYLEAEQPAKAWEITLEAAKNNNSQAPSFRIVRKFYWHFIKGNKFYNCIALANYLRFALDYKEDYQGWNYLLNGMVHLQPFEYWCLVAKKLYQLNLMEKNTNKGGETDILTKKQYETVNQYGNNLQEGFDIRRPFESNLEKQLADQILKRLFWEDGPKWELQDNTMDFQHTTELFINASK
ncbi:hypothetical protein FOA43_004687 [Brettanomyces nanus]|uniref:Uncharacterized protein n=1 Tax=Eeniella nana TaxID=13502 RepID=A0A875SCX0_EENNA|nr:uncharacterized protein FOA43_004687 [Brettanomyces nanus]QPG77279.1 hypothetical protein FOA43_004687 [Brettanomyces nanus]